jgi:hypothetical protein
MIPNEKMGKYLKDQQKFMTPAPNMHNKPLRAPYDLDSILNDNQGVKIIDKNK